MKRLRGANLKFLWMTALAGVFGPARLFACAVCYGQSDAPMARGLTWAILALGGIIACVLSGVVVFFVHAGRKSSALAEKNSTSLTESRNP